MVIIETGISPLFVKTLKLHIDYILKVLEMPDERLPKIVAMKTIQTRNLWFRKLEELAGYCGMQFHFTTTNPRLLKVMLYELISKVDEQYRKRFDLRLY